MAGKNNTIQYDKEIRELVAARLESLPDGAVISIGSDGNYKKEDIISSVREGNELGNKMIKIEMDFLQGLKEGILYEKTPFDHHA